LVDTFRSFLASRLQMIEPLGRLAEEFAHHDLKFQRAITYSSAPGSSRSCHSPRDGVSSMARKDLNTSTNFVGGIRELEPRPACR
jgi:hypothetical protein